MNIFRRYFAASALCFTFFKSGTAFAAIVLGDIWTLGDSITAGANVPGGYRDRLYSDLKNGGYTFTMVGTATNNSTTQLTNAGQDHHDGHSAWTIANTGTPTDPESTVGLYEAVNGWFPAIARPEIILLMIGTNDINRNLDVSSAPARLELLINRLVLLAPSARLIVSSILSADQNNAFRHGSKTNLATTIAAYNSAMASIVTQHQAAGQNVSFLDMNSKLTLTDLADGLHPNQTGYNKMGDAWAAAIVPEPATTGLLIVGLLTAGCHRRRRRTAPGARLEC